MVVERGLARCPRCVAVADYVFVESDGNRIRYEVHCRKCGECYSEDARPVANLPAVVEETLRWPPDWLPEPPRDWRNEVREKAMVVAQRGRAEADELGKRAHAYYEHTLTWVNERRAERALRAMNQTGGYAGGG